MKKRLVLPTLLCILTAAGSGIAQDSSGVRMVGRTYNDWDGAWGVALDHGYAYVAAGESGLRIVEVADPGNLREVGFYDTPGWAEGIAVAGDFAFVGGHDAGLRVVDISDPANPSETGFYDTPGLALGVAVAGDYAFVADADAGLRVVNISDPINPREAGFYDTPGSARGVAVAGDYAFVADYLPALRVVNISDPANPREAGFYDMPGYARGVAVAGDYAFVADADAGLRVVNISNPTNPREAGFYDTPGSAFSVAVAENGLVYVADRTNLGIYDCSEAMGVSSDFIRHPLSFILSAFPNPFNASAVVHYQLPSLGWVDLSLHDIGGRLVKTLHSGWQIAGEHRVLVNASSLAAGEYLLVLTDGRGQSEARNMVMVK